jgi:shikimate kinase
MNTLLQERLPLYEAAATAVVETSGRPIREIVADVMAVLQHD